MRKTRVTEGKSAEKQVAEFMAKYDPAIAKLARAALVRLRERLPGAVELVYDNYNALVIGFSPTERASDAIISLALYPRWVNLFFLEGAYLSDPHKLLKGDGKLVRSVKLGDAATVDKPEIAALIAQAVAFCDQEFAAQAPRRLIIKSISAKQRPRRPSGEAAHRVR
ncbi:MAG TPA: hypothetical protein VMM84_06385 [Pyrinomonadaceae bacterium]|nr:hypothetical protein [Pyrinomonadaceae bacterium]